MGTIADRARFDGSRVGALIRSYVEAAVLVVEIQKLANHEIVVIYVRNPDGLPVPFNKGGQHPGPAAGDKDVTVFRKGEIFVREGAENVPIRYAHWADLLSSYTRGIRDQSTEAALSMLREVLIGRDGAAGDAGVPLLADMDETNFAATAVRLLETGNDVRLRQFLRTVSRSTGAAVDLAAFADAVDRWAIFCAQTLHFERPDLTDEAIDKLVESSQGLGISADDDGRRLMTVERIYVVGSLAVRLGAWETVRSLALRPVPGNSYETGYVYSSWIRAAQVYASRAGLTADPRGDYLLSAARELMMEHPAMRPDLTDTAVPPGEAAPSDPALNSLCEFDLAYCIVVTALGTDRSSGYPSSAAFDEDRAKLVAQKIVADPEMRHRLLPNVDDPAVADALPHLRTAIRQSASSYGTRWWAMPPAWTRSSAAIVRRRSNHQRPWPETSVDRWCSHHHAKLGLTASHASHCRPSSSAVQRRMATTAVAPSQIGEAAAAARVPSRVNAAGRPPSFAPERSGQIFFVGFDETGRRGGRRDRDVLGCKGFGACGVRGARMWLGGEPVLLLAADCCPGRVNVGAGPIPRCGQTHQ